MIVGDRVMPEADVLSKDRWDVVRQLHGEQVSISEIARRLDIDRKMGRKLLREDWKQYERPTNPDTLLVAHETFIAQRAPEVNYSARILHQALVRHHGYGGSYETVKRHIVPLRTQAADPGGICQRRFETAPGEQSQIDWGQLRTQLRSQPVVLHVFVLTLGNSRRGYYRVCANERLGLFLESHEAAFAHFGGLTRELLYDPAPCVSRSREKAGVGTRRSVRSPVTGVGGEPRGCAPYRAPSKGKVESGVKYVKRNFLPGRRFTGIVDVQEQLDNWITTVADVRVHSTTHQRPIDRFAEEGSVLLPNAGHGAVGERRVVSRIVSDDYLVSFRGNRYFIPFGLIGKMVKVVPVGDSLRIEHGGVLVAEHPLLADKHQMRILPEHGLGPAARNGRKLFGLAGAATTSRWW